MINPINSVSNVINATTGVVEILGSATSSIIKEANNVRGRYVQKMGETDEAYRMRLEFIENKERVRQENKIRRLETKAKRKTCS